MTLVEVLITLVFLSIGLVPVFLVVSMANNLAISIKNNLIAANLAQEGVEVVRSIRDSNWFNGVAYNTNLSNGDYLIEWNSAGLLPFNPNSFLRQQSNGVYSYNSLGQTTPFKRRINVANVGGSCNCELVVLSEVTWLERGNKTKQISLEDHLFNWR